MRVAIVGAGAIGCTLGAFLSERAGADVELVTRGEHLRALQSSGLVLQSPSGAKNFRLPASDKVSEGAELVILATKLQDLDAAAAAAAARAPEPTALTVQNGLAAEDIALRHFPPGRVVGCVTALVAEFTRPGQVQVQNVGGLVLGRPGVQVSDARVWSTADLLKRAGLPVTVTDNLVGARWMKLIGNLNNALPAATGRPLQDIYRDAGMRRFGVRMIREGLRVAKAEKVRLEPLPWGSPRLARTLARLPTVWAGRILERRVRKVAGASPLSGSTLQSLQRGKTTEIDYLNGEIVRRGDTHRVATPVNAAIVNAVHEVERTGRFLAFEQLSKA